jgi:hypothetical protein
MTSTDERNHSDCYRAKSEIRDIHQQRELVDRNLMKLPARGHFARCGKWTTSGEGKGDWLSTWSRLTIEDNLGLRPEYLKDQDKSIGTEMVSEEKSYLLNIAEQICQIPRER